MVLFGRTMCIIVRHVDGIIDPSLAVIRAGLRCMLRGSTGGAAHITSVIDVLRVGTWRA
jgi:hypothetical protein